MLLRLSPINRRKLLIPILYHYKKTNFVKRKTKQNKNKTNKQKRKTKQNKTKQKTNKQTETKNKEIVIIFGSL